jgi:hypothetical protein
MPQELPLTSDDPDYEVATELGGVQVLLGVRWNTRDEAWYLSMFKEDGTPIRIGMRLVLGALLGGRCTDPAFPPGYLIAEDLDGTGIEAGIEDLGVRVRVLFWTSEELGLS